MRYLLIIFILSYTVAAFAQTSDASAEIEQLAERLRLRYSQQRAEALMLAAERELPIRQEFADGRVIQLMRIVNRMPVYYTTTNAEGASLLNSDRVYQDGGAGLSLSGAGQTLGIWDAGRVRLEHQEFTSRAVQRDNSSTNHFHSTHVAGTMIAAGVDSQAKGMAYQAYLDAYDWNNDSAKMADAAAEGLKVSQHSYGMITGWNFNSNEDVWYWYGDKRISETEDNMFGYYDYYARDWDEIAYSAPHYLIVKSAGNDRGQGPEPGTNHYVWDFDEEDLVESTTVREKDGGADGFDSIPRNGTAKNIITVGAVNAAQNMTFFSGWGPTDDGRVKPDLVAKGVAVYSTNSPDDDTYSSLSGTSMSSPMISGSIGLLLEHQENLHPEVKLRSSTIKALAIHTADTDISGAPGPDYRYGWGLMDTEKAALLMSENQELENHIFELTLEENAELEIAVRAKGNEPLIATIGWTDPPGVIPPYSLNPTDLILINDLDLRIYSTNETEFQPYILDPANPSNPATTGDNFRDNIEMVFVESPQAGAFYTLTISHKDELLDGTQQFSLIISGNNATYIGGIPELDQPLIVLTEIIDGDVHLVWEEVEDANSYIIYSSLDPSKDFEEWDYITTLSADTLNFSEQTTGRRFYRVVASIYTANE